MPYFGLYCCLYCIGVCMYRAMLWCGVVWCSVICVVLSCEFGCALRCVVLYCVMCCVLYCAVLLCIMLSDGGSASCLGQL